MHIKIKTLYITFFVSNPFQNQEDLEVDPYSSVIADKPLLLSEHENSVFSGLAESPVW